MKKLKLISLKVISTAIEEAKIINFNDWITVFTSEESPGNSQNHTGKSLIAKSIYYAFGADLNKYTISWKELKIVTIVDFEYQNVFYSLFRQKNKFILVNKTHNVIKFFNDTAQLKNFYNDLFMLKLKLLKKNDDLKHNPYPQALFLPFYIDQDKGWSSNWDSFNSLGMYKNPLKEIFEFYTGAKTNNYYDLLQKQDSLYAKNTKIKESYNKYQIAINENMNNFKQNIGANLEIRNFKKEIDILLIELNKIQKIKNKLKSELLKFNNEKYSLEESIKNCTTILDDLEKDETYINQNCSSNTIKCPICGVEHSNNESIKYIFSLDIENCKKDINELIIKKEKIDKKINDIQKNILDTSSKENKINMLLNKTKKRVKLKDVIISEGVKTLLKELQKKQNNCLRKIEENDEEISFIKKDLNHYMKIQKERNTEFQNIMKKHIQSLDITDIEPNTIGEKNSAGGSDIPKGMLAYTLSYYQMICKNKDALIMPMVLDTMVQQDPSPKNILDMFNLLLKEFPKDCQLVIATTNLYNLDFKSEPYRFLQKNKALSKKDFDDIKDEYFMFLDKIREYSKLKTI